VCFRVGVAPLFDQREGRRGQVLSAAAYVQGNTTYQLPGACAQSAYAAPASDMAAYCNVGNTVTPVENPDVKRMLAY
jgi:hypothetical protein